MRDSGPPPPGKGAAESGWRVEQRMGYQEAGKRGETTGGAFKHWARSDSAFPLFRVFAMRSFPDISRKRGRAETRRGSFASSSARSSNLLWRRRGRVTINATADSEKIGRHRILLQIEAALQLLDGHELAGLHVANRFCRLAPPRGSFVLEAKKIELNLPPLTLRHTRKSLLDLENAHNGRVKWDYGSSSERFRRTSKVSHEGNWRAAWRIETPHALSFEVRGNQGSGSKRQGMRYSALSEVLALAELRVCGLACVGVQKRIVAEGPIFKVPWSAVAEWPGNQGPSGVPVPTGNLSAAGAPARGRAACRVSPSLRW